MDVLEVVRYDRADVGAVGVQKGKDNHVAGVLVGKACRLSELIGELKPGRLLAGGEGRASKIASLATAASNCRQNRDNDGNQNHVQGLHGSGGGQGGLCSVHAALNQRRNGRDEDD